MSDAGDLQLDVELGLTGLALPCLLYVCLALTVFDCVCLCLVGLAWVRLAWVWVAGWAWVWIAGWLGFGWLGFGFWVWGQHLLLPMCKLVTISSVMTGNLISSERNSSMWKLVLVMD